MEIIEASLPFKHERMLYCCSELEGCQDSKKSDLVLEDFRLLFMRGSGVLNISILSISLLECFPAWPNVHLLNDGSSKAVCLFTT